MLGLPPYRLPQGFTSMPAPQQWLILANLDRAAYGIEAIAGTAHAAQRASRAGVRRRTPIPTRGRCCGRCHGQRLIGFGSNWAGGQPNALVAYFGWMYDDGHGDGNLDCHSPSDPGCWGHRRNILAFPARPR